MFIIFKVKQNQGSKKAICEIVFKILHSGFCSKTNNLHLCFGVPCIWHQLIKFQKYKLLCSCIVACKSEDSIVYQNVHAGNTFQSPSIHFYRTGAEKLPLAGTSEEAVLPRCLIAATLSRLLVSDLGQNAKVRESKVQGWHTSLQPHSRGSYTQSHPACSFMGMGTNADVSPPA